MIKVPLIILFLISTQNLYSQNRETSVMVDQKKVEEYRVYSSNEVDSVAYFPNGKSAWEEYLLASSKYPEMPKKYQSRGRIYLSFVIEKDGRITDAVVTRGLNIKCDEEALRLLRSSGKWVPAIIKSKRVRSKGNISIKFGFG